VSPDADAIHARRWYILGVLNLSLVIIVAANSSLNVAIPTLIRELHATNSQLEWLVAGYSLVFAGLVMPMGALGDRFGRKGVLQVGLSVFAFASLGGMFATSPWHLVAARVVMGVGGAMIMPATLSIVANVFPPEERAKAIAIWAGFAGAGVSVGPLTSGVLLDHFWFGSIFFVNVPIIAAALIAGAYLLPTSRDPRQQPLDLIGSGLSIVGLCSLLYAIIQGPDRGWTDSYIIDAFVIAVVVLTVFVWWERRSDHPMLPIEQFGDRRFSAGAGAIALTFFVMFGLFFTSTQFLQLVHGFSPLSAGAAMLPMATMMVVMSSRSAPLADRFGRDRVMATGLVFIAGGMLIMSTLTPTSSYWTMAVALVFFGTGMALTMAPATGAVMESMPLAKAGVGSAVNDTTREVGGSLGVAVLGSLLSTGYRSHLSPHLAALPAQAAAQARASLGGALKVAALAPRSTGDTLAAAARHAFTDGMSVVFIIAAVIAVLTAALQLVVMPGRRGRVVTYVHPEPDELRAVAGE